VHVDTPFILSVPAGICVRSRRASLLAASFWQQRDHRDFRMDESARIDDYLSDRLGDGGGSVIRRLLATALLLFALMGNAPSTWVNMKDSALPGGPAIGNGTTDDTAAAQAAIDYCTANQPCNAIYCPAGNYKISNTLWLDPSNDMRATTWTGTGYFAAGVFTVVSTSSGSLAGSQDYLWLTGTHTYTNLAGTSGPTITTGGSGPYTVNNSFTLGSSGSPVALTAFNPSNPQQFSFQMSFFGDPSNEAYFPGCKLSFTFNNGPAFVVGDGQGMHVADMAVIGPNGGYRCGQPSGGIGIAVTGGNGGSHINLIEDTTVQNFYSLWETDANNGPGLSDSNTFRNPNGQNGCIGINLTGTQSYINDIVEPTIGDTNIAISDVWSHQLNVFGGNLSAGGAQNSGPLNMGTVTISAPDQHTFNLTAIISPTSDTNIGTIYNSYAVVTPHFGIVPMTMTSYNSSTGAAGFLVWQPWIDANFAANHPYVPYFIPLLQADLTNATVYGAERVEVAKGTGIVLEGQHIENQSNNAACTTLLDMESVWNNQPSNEIRDPYFDYDTSIVTGYPNTAEMYCQQSFPFINAGLGVGYSLKLSGGSYGASNPLIVDASPLTLIDGKQIGYLPTLNLRVSDSGATSYGQIPQWNAIGPVFYDGQFATAARGSGTWDTDYFRPWASASSPTFTSLLTSSEVSAPFCGYEPCPWSNPNLSTTFYGMVSGSASVTGTIDNGSGTGTPAGTTMTVSAVGSGLLGPGNAVTGSGVTAGTAIVAQIGGTTGGIGTYLVNNSQGIASEALTSSLGALGSYPPYACRTVFKSLDWNTGNSSISGGSAPTKLFLRTNSCPGYTYGQNLTQATVGSTANATGTGYVSNGSSSAGTILNWTKTAGTLNDGDAITGSGISTGTYVVAQLSGTTGGTGTYQVSVSQLAGSSGSPLTLTAPSVTWAYMTNSNVLYLDAATIQWMFPGLGISLNNGSGAQPYTITGVYPFLGYVTVIWAGSPGGGLLQGASPGTTYSCASSCTIAQAPFAWTAY
jgi:hypothetical protein